MPVRHKHIKYTQGLVCVADVVVVVVHSGGGGGGGGGGGCGSRGSQINY